ncbi:MAG TPA: hypothetical protein PLX50_05615 [Candidatus Aminicenantes bacterium]|nr:hypothetical protein [Acidobacteriota bacterium]HOI45068.1 hypothetical protein [Candidatus Aminicenantes bacterium]
MKKALAFMLVALFVASFLFVFPRAGEARMADCFIDWETCRQYALATNEGWIRTTLMLTVCDVARGKCVLGL